MLSERDKKAMVEEALDPNKLNFWCKKHNYFGPIKGDPNKSKPFMGCSDCWMIFYIHEMASCPPEKRYEKLQEIEEVLNQVVEMVEKGTWDFAPYDHAQVEIGQE
jgi:hypothetical protein